MADEKTADAGQQRNSSYDRSDEQIRNLSDLQKAIDKREEYKSQANSLKEQVNEMQAQIESLTASNQKKTGEFEKLYSSEASKHKSLQEKYSALEQQNMELTGMVENFKAEALMKDFMNETLKTVKHRDRAEVLLLGLAASQKVDLTPETDLEEHATAARKLLEEIDPSLFTSDERRAGSVPGNIPGARINSNGQATTLGQFKLLPTRK